MSKPLDLSKMAESILGAGLSRPQPEINQTLTQSQVYIMLSMGHKYADFLGFPALDFVEKVDQLDDFLVKAELILPEKTVAQIEIYYDFETLEDSEKILFGRHAKIFPRHNRCIYMSIPIHELWARVGGGDLDRGADLLEASARSYYDALKEEWEAS